MAQLKISEALASKPAAALNGTEGFYVLQSSDTKGATAEQIREYVASQPNVFTVTQRIESAAPAFQFSENDTVDKNWEFIGVAGALRLDELSDAFSTTGTHHTFTHGGGTQFGSPTGGDQGAGTVNATGLYQDGVGVPTLDGGADANFTAMPQVGGDPIVESGSNAAGEFTKWASGAQYNTGTVDSIDVNTAAGNNFFGAATATLPAAFLDTAENTATASDSTSNVIWGSGRVSTDGVSVTVILFRNGTTSTGRTAAYMAIGRWK